MFVQTPVPIEAKSNFDDSTSNNSGRYSYYNTPSKQKLPSNKSFSSNKGCPPLHTGCKSKRSGGQGAKYVKKVEGKTLWVPKSESKAAALSKAQVFQEPVMKFTSASKGHRLPLSDAATDSKTDTESSDARYPIRKTYSMQF